MNEETAGTAASQINDRGDERENPRRTPTVGRIVHYIAFGTPNGEYTAGAHRAAIVTAIHNERVDLCVFNPTGLHFREDVPFEVEAVTPGTWHWPEQV